MSPWRAFGKGEDKRKKELRAYIFRGAYATFYIFVSPWRAFGKGEDKRKKELRAYIFRGAYATFYIVVSPWRALMYLNHLNFLNLLNLLNPLNLLNLLNFLNFLNLLNLINLLNHFQCSILHYYLSLCFSISPFSFPLCFILRRKSDWQDLAGQKNCSWKWSCLLLPYGLIIVLIRFKPI